MRSERALLFVYGTLMRGEVAHERLGDARFIEAAHTEPCFSLLDMGEYPALAAGGSTRVTGELYEIDAARLSALDEYEDVPEVYERAVIRVAERDAVAYVLKPEHAKGRPVLASGDWHRR